MWGLVGNVVFGVYNIIFCRRGYDLLTEMEMELGLRAETSCNSSVVEWVVVWWQLLVEV